LGFWGVFVGGGGDFPSSIWRKRVKEVCVHWVAAREREPTPVSWRERGRGGSREKRKNASTKNSKTKITSSYTGKGKKKKKGDAVTVLDRKEKGGGTIKFYYSKEADSSLRGRVSEHLSWVGETTDSFSIFLRAILPLSPSRGRKKSSR